jgi:parallel beta-helix repeat protein
VASIVSGNLIGTDFQTRYQLPNGGNGVSVSGAGATGTRIGKAVDSLPGNIISGNGGDGVFVGGGATGTFIGGNTIGLSTFGNARIANGGNGVTILAAYNNTIGGPLDSNLISGNTGDGICLCTGSAGTFVGVNVIGVDTLGSHAMGNGGDGIRIAYSAGNHLAGGVDIPGLLIGGNTLNGIRLAGASSTGNEITGAAIGGGLTIPIPNSLNGILIENGASNNKIGLAGVGNVISANLSSGVFISAGSGNEIRTNTIRGNGASGIRIVSGIGNRLTLNRISSNGGLGIDLGAVGVTPNDPDDSDSGPNGLQNFPLVASASAGGIETHVVGSLTSSASTTFRVEFFSSTACDPSAHGEGEVFLGSTDVSTDAIGVGLYDAILPVPAFGPFITATATDPVGNTSEFSACALLAGPVLTAISPTSGPAAGGTPVALTGMGFQSTVTVAFGTAAATSPMSSDDQHATAVTPALAPGLLYDVTLTNLDGLSATLPKGWLADFLDVPGSSGLHPFVEKVVRRSIAAGCTGGNFCVSDPVTRAQVAVFLLRAHDGPSYNPPPATGTVFTDVPANGFAAAWIEELATRGVTAGCGGGAYCPGLAMTRAQMAVFLLRAKNGPSYVAPDPTGIFADVPISSPYARWVEELFHEGATAGCGGGNFCPDGPNTRGQMAVFLVTMFGL